MDLSEGTMKGGLAMMYVGLDLHKKYSYVTTVDEKGKVISSGKLTNDGAVLRDYFGVLRQGVEGDWVRF